MAAGIIRINSPKLKSDGEAVERLNGSIPILVDELEAEMKRLSECWEGAAWAGYQENMAEYFMELREMYEYMGRFAGNMLQAGQDYMRTEQDIFNNI